MRMAELLYYIVFIYFLYEMGSARACDCDPRCRCTNVSGSYYADCSKRNLSSTLCFSESVISIDLGMNNYDFIPKHLPQRLKYLNMTRNPITKVSATMLIRYTDLQFLTLSYCKLTEVESGAFNRNKNLRYLDISNNNELSLSVLSNISYDLKDSCIKVLNLENVQCRFGPSQVVPLDYTKHLQNTNLEDLNIAGNRISGLDYRVVMNLPKSLKHLNIAGNMLTFGSYLFYFGCLHNLLSLNISYQMSLKVDNFSPRCDDGKLNKGINKMVEPRYFHSQTFLLNRINSKHTEKAKITVTDIYDAFHKTKEDGQLKCGYYSFSKRRLNNVNFTFYFPPNLTSLYFHNSVYKVSTRGLNLGTNGRLEQLNIKNNIIPSLTDQSLDLGNLRYFDMSNSFCSYIAKDFFSNVSNLLLLNLSRNELGNVIENDQKGDIFRDMRNLRVLDLSYNRLFSLPKAIFRNMNRLERLDLRFNKLDVIHFELRHMKNLSFIDLSYNQIQNIDSVMRAALDIISKRSHIIVNINENPLFCTCKELEFVKWLHSSTNIHFKGISHYKCHYENSTRIYLINLDQLLEKLEKCCASYQYLNAVTASIILILTLVIIIRIIYRYRWSLRYWYYVAKKESDLQRHTENCCKYRFNAFISYADEDREFVVNNISTLEEEYGLRLVIHDRDFIPGVDIAENITNAIHNSQKTVCVISENFLRSYWCRFELNMARMESIYSREGENALFLVIMNENIVATMPMELLILIETQSYLSYSSGNGATQGFRQKLAETLL